MTGGLFRGSDRVGEEHAHVIEALRDPSAGRGLELLDDRLGQHVEEEPVGPRPFLVELTCAEEQLSSEPFRPIGGQPAQQAERDQVEHRQHQTHVLRCTSP